MRSHGSALVFSLPPLLLLGLVTCSTARNEPVDDGRVVATADGAASVVDAGAADTAVDGERRPVAEGGPDLGGPLDAPGVQPADAGSSDRVSAPDAEPDTARLLIPPYSATWMTATPIISGVAVAGDDIFAVGALTGTLDLGDETVLKSAGQLDVFVARYGSDGKLRWAKLFGTVEEEYGYQIASAPNGDIAVSGFFRGTSLMVGQSNLVGTNNDPAARNSFVARLSAEGNVLWAKSTNDGRGLAFDRSGNLLAGGGNGRSLLEIFGAAGQKVSTVGPTFSAGLDVLQADQMGNVLGCGEFHGAVNVTVGGTARAFDAGAGRAIFALKVGGEGQVLWFATVASGGFEDSCEAITVDDAGNLYLAGYFSSGVQLGPGATSATKADMMAALAAPDGRRLWIKTFNQLVGFDGLAIDAQGALVTLQRLLSQDNADLGGGTVKAPAILGRFLASSGGYLSASPLSLNVIRLVRHGSGDLLLTGSDTLIRLALP